MQKEEQQKTEEIEERLDALTAEALSRNPNITQASIDELRAEIEQLEKIESEPTVFIPEGEYSRSQIQEFLNEFPNWEGKKHILDTIEKSLRRKN